MLSQLRPAIVMIVLFTALTGIAYPLAITGIAQVAFRGSADGSLITRKGIVVGSALVGQNFVADGYFHGRPSATSDTDPADATKTVDAPYNAASSLGSNLGPTSQKLIDRVRESTALLGGGPGHPVPADAVTTSASGLDPDISPAYAMLQVGRVAGARKMQPERVRALVSATIAQPLPFGERVVNVLALNLALDAVNSTQGAAPSP